MLIRYVNRPEEDEAATRGEHRGDDLRLEDGDHSGEEVPEHPVEDRVPGVVEDMEDAGEDTVEENIERVEGVVMGEDDIHESGIEGHVEEGR